MEGSRFAYHHDPNKDPQKIIDFYKDSNDTVTCFDDEYLSSASGVAYGFFDSESRRVYFGANDPGGTVAYLRGRPSVRVMEY
jgi:hypothetical protein